MSLTAKWNSLKIQNRIILMIVSFTVTLYYTYEFNIKKTISLVRKCTQLRQNITPLSQQSKHNDNGPSTFEHQSKDKSFLKTISIFCEENGIDINEISQTSTNRVEECTVETSRILLEGKYSDVLELIHFIEFIDKSASINSLTFQLLRDKTNDNSYSLVTIIYIKHVKYEVFKV